jgi:uncharacterized protein with FMN-binding domain
MKPIKKVLLALLALILLAGWAGFSALRQMSEKLDAMVNANIDMTQVADGVYQGQSDGGLIKVEVEVTVKDNRITQINLLRHDNGKGTPAEATLEEMIEQNTDDVDVVSGATLSSRAIRNAVNLALQKGLAGGQAD